MLNCVFRLLCLTVIVIYNYVFCFVMFDACFVLCFVCVVGLCCCIYIYIALLLFD